MADVEAYRPWEWGVAYAVRDLGNAPDPANEPGFDHAAVLWITQMDVAPGLTSAAQRALTLGLDPEDLSMVNFIDRELHFTLQDRGAPGFAAVVTSGAAKLALDWAAPYR